MKKSILHDLATVERDGMPHLLDWMRENDYFSAPASTKYHLSCEGGLATHSWNVYQALADINTRYALGVPQDSVILCGLLHDLCKVNVYKKEMKRTRSPEGAWSDQLVWVMKDELPLGHGEKSVIQIQKFISLTADEQLAIRWHMSSWDAEGYGAKRSLGEAMDKCILLKALILADQTATWMKEAYVQK